MRSMYDNFYEFYRASGNGGGKQVRWKRLEEVLKIRQKNYPSNQRLLDYYTETFRCNTSALVRSKWHNMDKLLYVWVVSKWCDMHSKNILALEDFVEFASILGVSESLLEFKWLKLAKPYVKNIPWEAAEDDLLSGLMKTQAQKKWTQIALKLFESGVSRILRTAKQVRQRWVNYIDPQLNRADWTQQEDGRLLTVVDTIGRKWSEIGKMFRRTENNVKNRYNSLAWKSTRANNDQFDPVPSQEEPEEKISATKVKMQPKAMQPLIIRVATFRPLESKVCSFRTINYQELPAYSDSQ